MCPLIGNVRCFNGCSARHLPLHRHVPGIQGWQTLEQRTDMRVHVILRTEERQLAIAGDSGEYVWRRAPVQCECCDVTVCSGLTIVVGVYVLPNQHGQILSNSMSKVRPKHAHVEAAAVAQTDHRLRVPLVSDT